MAYFKATLTLPGIAGIALTVGMAVDANVLVFERVREELRLGRTPKASIHAGFDKALKTIVDSNLTTLIAALFLLAYGTGPVKGFAVTLSVGIIANLFTAVFMSRVLFDALLTLKPKLERLSI
jgi:preprotein translocase subunit SecD